MLCAGFTKADPVNFTTDFAVFGVRGVMNGAAIIFFAYLGYDAVATLAEEVRTLVCCAAEMLKTSSAFACRGKAQL